jgi:hypothetical protein
MPQLLSTVGTFLSSNTGALKTLGTVAGVGSNIYSGVNNAINTSKYNDTQSYIQSLVKDPTKMAAAAAKLQQPLSAGLTDQVTNQAQAQLAERGLGGSPAAMSSVITQSLAPYVQQNQSTAMSALMNSLGLGSSTRPQALPNVDLSKLMAMLKTGGTSDPTASMAQTGFNDTQTTPTLDLNSGVMPTDYATSYGT